MCVAAAQAKIVGPEDVYVKKGSTISLTCTVNVQSTPPSSVSWHHGGDVVDFDSPRYKPRESSSRVLAVNVPSPLAPAPLFHARPRQLVGRAGGERGRQKRREKLIPFRSIASRYDYRWCALWERDASNVMHPPIASIFFHHGEKLEESNRSRLSRRIFYYNSNISNRLEDDFFCLANPYGNGWEEKLERFVPFESSRVAGTRVDASRDGKQNEQQIGSWWLLHTFRDS